MKTGTYYAGVDVGRSGALALMSPTGVYARVWEMPPKMDRGIDMRGLKEIIQQFPVDTQVAIEWNQSRPGEVPDFAFRFGLQTGQIDGLLYGMGLTVTHVSPRTWKPALGLLGKQADYGSAFAAAFWEALYPVHAKLIRGPRGGLLDGPLDALLICEYLRRITESPVGNKGGPRPPRYRGIPLEMLKGAFDK